MIGWEQLDRPCKVGEALLTPSELRAGFTLNLPDIYFRLSFKIIERLPSGNYIVEDPRVKGIGV